MDWFFELLLPAQWDALRNWLATIGGLVALVIALVTYSSNARVRRESQARLVYGTVDYQGAFSADTALSAADNHAVEVGLTKVVKSVDRYSLMEQTEYVTLSDGMTARVAVHNESQELIGPVKVQLADASNGEIWDRVSARIQVIEPSSTGHASLSWSTPWLGAGSDLLVILSFRDSSGRWWQRFGTLPIESIHDDPVNTGITQHERQMRSLDPWDWTLPPEPHLTLAVRWHRLMRKLRHKKPLV